MWWRPRSPYEQAEFPAPPPDRYAQAVRRDLPRILFGKLTLLPYIPAGIRDTVGRLLVSSWYPAAVVAQRGYGGEAYVRMQPELVIPHPSGLDPQTRLAAPKAQEERRG